jgi:hypothetical protein
MEQTIYQNPFLTMANLLRDFRQHCVAEIGLNENPKLLTARVGEFLGGIAGLVNDCEGSAEDARSVAAERRGSIRSGAAGAGENGVKREPRALEEWQEAVDAKFPFSCRNRERVRGVKSDLQAFGKQKMGNGKRTWTPVFASPFPCRCNSIYLASDNQLREEPRYTGRSL